MVSLVPVVSSVEKYISTMDLVFVVQYLMNFCRTIMVVLVTIIPLLDEFLFYVILITTNKVYRN